MVVPSTAPVSATVASRAKGKRRLLPASKNFLATGMAAALASEAVAGAPSQPDSERECHCIYGNDGVPVKAQCGALLIHLHEQAPDQLADLLAPPSPARRLEGAGSAKQPLALEEEVRETDSAATEERKRLSERMDAIEDADDGEANEAVRDQLAAHEERLDAIEENMPPRRLRLWMPPPALEE